METDRPARSSDTRSSVGRTPPDPVTAQLTRRRPEVGRRTHVIGASAAALVVLIGLGAAAAFGSTTSGVRSPLLAGARPGAAPAGPPTVAPSDTPHPTTSTFDSAAPDPTTSPSFPPPDSTTVSIDQLHNGDCLRDGITKISTLDEVVTVPCSKPHSLELFTTWNLPGTAFPGQPAVRRESQQGCDARFRAFIGRSYDSSSLQAADIHPTAASWATGDRAVRCLVGEPNERKRTGSLRNAQR